MWLGEFREVFLEQGLVFLSEGDCVLKSKTMVFLSDPVEAAFAVGHSMDFGFKSWFFRVLSGKL